MNNVVLKPDPNGHSAFYIMDGPDQLAKMEIGIAGNKMTVYHTYVAPESEGKGMAKILLEAMVDYAHKNELKVIPLCPYVHTQFERHPQQYVDVWYKEQPVNEIKDKSDPWIYT
jgi:predicted GNAT family acetyltransferase